MIIRDVKFKSNAKNERLIQDFEENLVDLADQLAVCHAEIRKWKAFERAAAQGLFEGMRLCEIAQLTTDDHVFTLSHDTVEVEYDKGVVH
jgi:hypothetical protein